MAAATVPEYVTSSPRLAPALTPESTRLGRLSRSTALMARSTQSVGVPSTAKRRGPSLRIRSGRLSVSEWLAPLCSCSGATTHTSLQRVRATLASSLIPGELMPSSLEMRMRAAARSMGRSNIAADHRQAAHIRLEGLRHGNRPVSLLEILEHGDERAPHGKAGAVERMHEPCPLAVLRPETPLHPPCLEIAAIGAAGDFAIGALSRQPYFDVIGLARGKAHVAG